MKKRNLFALLLTFALLVSLSACVDPTTGNTSDTDPDSHIGAPVSDVVSDTVADIVTREESVPDSDADTDEWPDRDNMAFSPDTTSAMVRISDIESDCFFVKTFDYPAWTIKIHAILPDCYRVGNEVMLTYENVYTDAEGRRKEADLVDIVEIAAPKKPVIYLYPEVETDVSVKLTVDGRLTCTYPAYRDGWRVTAAPDGTLTDADGMTYNYLYWEGVSDVEWDMSRGFCVRGEDTAAFLEWALEQLGLTRREANEFIIYWLPRMEGNAYNIIAFQTEIYTESAKLDITPAPDTLIRVFMAYRSSNVFVDIEPQVLTCPERIGFVAVEWGGAEG